MAKFGKAWWKFLFVPGVILLTAGLVAGLITRWSPPLVAIAVAGAIILVLWLGILASTGGFWKRRSTQAGTNAFVATGAVLVILGLINFLGVRYSEPIDLTEAKLFTLSPQTQQIIQKLEQPLKVWVFEGNPNPGDRQLLENYQRHSDNFEFEFVDPQVNLGLAERFNVQSVGEVYLEYGDKEQLVQTLTQGERLSEVQLTNAIGKIGRDRTLAVYFLQGHGEPTLDASEGGLSQAVTALEAQGYQVNPLNLAQQTQVPEDAAAIIVAGPKRELFAGEVSALQEFLDAGGSLLLMIDPQTNPGLDPLLNEWGVELSDRLIIDASGTGGLIGYGPATAIVTNYGNHPITIDFSNGISVYPLAQPIGTVAESGVEAVALLVTDEQSWAESDLDEEEVAFNPSEDIGGPLDVGVVLTRTESQTQGNQETSEANDLSGEEEAAEDSDSKLVVFGNSTFATNGWFEQQLNGDIFLNSVEWLAGGDEASLSIRPREPENRRLNLTPLQAGMISWLAVLVVPLLGLGAAVVAWWRRR